MTIDARTFLPRLATAKEAAETARLLGDRSRPFGTSATLEAGVTRFARAP
ncbi:MAG: hypothetical protein U1F43_30170 [Myxococcota bacterium]